MRWACWVGEPPNLACRPATRAAVPVRFVTTVARELPAVSRSKDSASVSLAAEAVMRAVDRAVASLAEAYTAARREMVQREETLHRELIEDLLRGDADVGALVERAEPFGMDMGQPHQVALALGRRRALQPSPVRPFESFLVNGSIAWRCECRGAVDERPRRCLHGVDVRGTWPGGRGLRRRSAGRDIATATITPRRGRAEPKALTGP